MRKITQKRWKSENFKMISPPKTRKEAERLTGGLKGRVKYNNQRCAYMVKRVFMRRAFRSQCIRKPGHGPDKLYCKQHAKMVER